MEKENTKVCNCCGRSLNEKEDVFLGRKEWGYFSGKDLETHEFILCEECYDKITEQFLIPVERRMKTEVL